MSVLIAGHLKVSLLDYPKKVATTVFLRGCNFNCAYCHNHDLIGMEGNEAISEEALFTYLKKRQGVLDGVCITGGEPLMSADLPHFLEKIKAMGYLIKLDTNGSFPKRLKALVERALVDYVAMDIKTSFNTYPKLIDKRGFEAEVRESFIYLNACTLPHEFRTTFIKPLHTIKIAEEMFQEIRGEANYYLQNFKMSEGVKSKVFSPFSAEEMETYLALAKQYLPHASLREL